MKKAGVYNSEADGNFELYYDPQGRMIIEHFEGGFLMEIDEGKEQIIEIINRSDYKGPSRLLALDWSWG